MKKILFILAFLLIAVPAWGQTWFTANQVTVAWNPVAKIETTDVVKYQVYLRQGTSGNGMAYEAEDTNNVPFGVVYLVAPSSVGGLRIAQ